MSKYSYTTVYEEFTGLKPPEPKTSKPRRRRGYGHPYRMRLNMQDEAQPNLENNLGEQPEKSFEATDHQPRSIFRTSQSRNPDTSSRLDESSHSHHNPHHTPKVTYKKRRHYNLSNMQSETLN
ncbi:hypothetical protein [Endozoicomonas sp. Mp262]|uniref:hypothetical protein n=1 Tax=Endozoicomonas sp. Mp262 TaxID=2919499 RepID=UPI0021DB3A77